MKTSPSIIGMIATALIVTACGSNDTSTSEVQSVKSQNSEAAIIDVKVLPINAGINPDAFAYVVSGRIGTGSNRCQAAGVKAYLKQIVVGDQIKVVPMLSSPVHSFNRICTREFMPQFADVTLTVRGSHSEITSVIIKNVGSLGEEKNIDELMVTVAETIIGDLVADPLRTAAGEFGYKITGKVLLGTNGCFASGNQAEFLVETFGDKISVTAVIKSTADAQNRICPMVYMPVFAELETIVNGAHSDIKTVEILNVEQLGNSRIIDLQ